MLCSQLEQFRCTYTVTEQGEGVVECHPFLRVFAETAGGAFVELGSLRKKSTGGQPGSESTDK